MWGGGGGGKKSCVLTGRRSVTKSVFIKWYPILEVKNAVR